MLKPLYEFNDLRIRFGFGAARKIYFGLRNKKSDEVSVPYLKSPVSVRKSNGSDIATFKEVLVRKDYDIELNFEPKRIIDAGANIGLTAVFFSNKFPNAEIIAIEPNTENFSIMNKNISHYPNVKAIQSAVWSKEANLQIVDEGRGSDGFIVKETSDGGFKALGVADIMKQAGWENIDILKMDVEGSEKEIFEGNYQDWLPKTKVLI